MSTCCVRWRELVLELLYGKLLLRCRRGVSFDRGRKIAACVQRGRARSHCAAAIRLQWAQCTVSPRRLVTPSTHSIAARRKRTRPETAVRQSASVRLALLLNHSKTNVGMAVQPRQWFTAWYRSTLCYSAAPHCLS